MKERYRQLLMAALAEVAAHDGIIRPNELQVLRAAASALGAPMPPLAAASED
jgi:tellurite resistance protein